MLLRFRIAAALLVALAVTAAPALTCLSFMAEMDMQQMECCKHMNDDCDMGMGNQSCCTHGNPQLVHAALPDKAVHLLPAMIAVQLVAESELPFPNRYAIFTTPNDGSPPLGPPGSITVLRI
jgi:hypothetical protein